MGLSNHLRDVSSDSLPLLLLASAAASLAYLRSLLLRLLPFAAAVAVVDDRSSLGSGLAGLVVLADHLVSNRPLIFSSSSSDGRRRQRPQCAVCLCRLADGDRVRRLPCRHVFHGECIDGWFHQLNLSCPLCRSELAAPGLRAAADRRMGPELVAWLSRY